MKSVQKSRRFAVFVRVSRVVCIAGLIIAVFSFLDVGTSAFNYIESLTYGDRLEVAGLCHPELAANAASNVKVISISDDTYQWAEQNGNNELTLPRKYQAILIRRLTKYGARVIAFDMLFDKPKPGDGDLAAAIKESGRVVLGCEDNGDKTLDVVYPEDALIKAGARLGLARVHIDVDSPEIDDVEPEVNTGTSLMPTLSVEAVRVAKGIADLPIGLTPGSHAIPGLPIVTDNSTDFPAFKIRFMCNGSTIANSGKDTIANTVFTNIKFEDIVGADSDEDAAYAPIFKDKVVIVGDTTKLSGDLRMTPLEPMPGVLVQANAIATLLSGKFIYEARPFYQVLMLTLLVILTTVLSSFWPLNKAAWLIILILPAFFLLNSWIFAYTSFYIHLAAPSAAIVLTAAVVLLERAMTEEKEKGHMRQLLGRYVNPRMADHILKNPELIGGQGKLQLGTMLFTDVRGFTKLSEALTPEELVRHMNEYFETMIDVVFKYDGTAVNLIGDAMLVVFGIPVPAPDHADRAVKAAIEMQSATAALREKWGVDETSGVSSGIGINTGEVVVGEIGGSQLRSFTVYGLQVNIASRVETLNKTLDTNILITRATYEALQNKVTVKGPTKAPVKGVAEPLDVFEVIWDA
jgi:class 3 adenylate cyclase/CHASE2 domain-containing sensor protein